MFIIRWFLSLFKKPQKYPTGMSSVEIGAQSTTSTGKPVQIEVVGDFKFVDSSHHHDFFDAKAYNAPIFINKCTQGTTFIDKTHAIRKKECAENGIKYGGYHFYECKKNPMQQVSHYMKTHGEFAMAPIADYETTTGQDEQDLINGKENFLLFLSELERVTGKKPWVYLNYSAAKRINFDEKFGRFPAWFARYNTFLGPIPAPWTEETTAAWQFTESGEFPGLKGGNDVNVYFLKSKALDPYLNQYACDAY